MLAQQMESYKKINISFYIVWNNDFLMLIATQ